MALFGRNNRQNTDTLILYGSKSGNAKKVAQLAQKYLMKNGHKTSFVNIKKYSPENLQRVQHLLVIISTHGEGDPPPAAKGFFKEVLSNNMSSLAHLKYSVCALGDSSYRLYCEAGRKMDNRLKELNAKPFYPRTECDVDFSASAVKWIKGSCQQLNGSCKINGNDIIENKALSKATYHARLVNKKVLSAGNTKKLCYHIELKTEHRDINFKPGDSIEILPENPTWLVEKILNITGIELGNCVNGNKNLSSKLLKELEITSISERTLRKYHEKVNNKILTSLLETPRELSAYLTCANVLDMLTDFNSTSFSISDLEDILPPVRYRQYSIASGQKNCTSVELTIKPVKYLYKDSWHEGAASNYLCHTLDIGTSISFRLFRNPDFYLPKVLSLPVIMIANGTGIAPFRAFLQQRETLGLIGKTWLLFGERCSYSDFYYKEEMVAFQQNGVLEKLNVAFSRDREQKVYVQDIIEEKSDELLNWLQDGAHIYVCGSLKMGKSVMKVLNAMLRGKKVEGISGVENLISLCRYHEDVY
ncbi:MAG: flavodoxin domain-containing protein [Bacteroidales bacterium]